MQRGTKWHRILGLEVSATEPEIKKAFKRKALLYHPDKNPSDDAKVQYELLCEAQEQLLAQPANFDSKQVQNRDFYKAKLFAKKSSLQNPQFLNNKFEDTSPEELALLNEKMRLVKHNLRKQMDPDYLTSTTGQKFTSLWEARMHVDEFGIQLKKSFPEAQYTDEFKLKTLNRLPE